MVVFPNFILMPFTVGIDKLPLKSFDLSNDILWWLLHFYHRFSLLLYLVLVISGAVAEF